MEARIARIESDVAHLKTDVADIKVDLRGLRDKMDDGFARMSTRMDSLKDGVSSAKTWGVMLYVTLAGMMLSVMARGFGWI